MTTELGPTVRRKQLGAELARLREAAGLRMDDAAEALDCSRPKISHIESGRYGVRKPDLAILLQLYNAPQEAFAALEKLRAEGAKPGWWAIYRLPEWLQAYIGLETDARDIRNFALELVPGLLQTEGYARSRYEGTDEVAERHIRARIQRQSRLTGTDPVNFSVVASEAILARTIGYGTVGVEQLRHLALMMQRPNIDLHILPFSAGPHGSQSGSFKLLSFPPGVALNVAYQEYAVGGHLVDDQAVVQELSELYDRLKEQALDVEESLRMITEYITRAEGEDIPRA